MPDGSRAALRLPIGAQATGLVRMLRQRLHDDAARLTAAAAKIPADVIVAAATKRNAVGLERVWTRLLARMPCPPRLMDRKRHVALWRLLRPGPAIMTRPDGSDFGDRQTVVSWLAIGRGRGRPMCQEGAWGLTFSDHALGRLLERTGFRADPEATMIEAHDTLLGASSGVARTMLDQREWAIPGSAGGFLGTTRVLTDAGDVLVMLTCETWIGEDQFWPEQAAQVAAIRFRESGRTLADGLLLPSVLRPVAEVQAGEAGRQFARMAL